MHFCKCYDYFAVGFYLIFSIHFFEHRFLCRGKPRQVYILEPPLQIIHFNLRFPLPILIPISNPSIKINKIGNLLGCKIITFINLVLEYVYLSLLNLPDKILVDPACHGGKLDILAVLEHGLHANDPFDADVLAILDTQLLGDSADLHVTAVADE